MWTLDIVYSIYDVKELMIKVAAATFQKKKIKFFLNIFTDLCFWIKSPTDVNQASFQESCEVTFISKWHLVNIIRHISQVE